MQFSARASTVSVHRCCRPFWLLSPMVCGYVYSQERIMAHALRDLPTSNVADGMAIERLIRK